MQHRGADDEAVPGLDPDAREKRGHLLHTLEVDGEVFEVRTHDGGTDYDWISGPNDGYGFSSSARDVPEDHHRESIRSFLSMIDPATGYIADDE